MKMKSMGVEVEGRQVKIPLGNGHVLIEKDLLGSGYWVFSAVADGLSSFRHNKKVSKQMNNFWIEFTFGQDEYKYLASYCEGMRLRESLERGGKEIFSAGAELYGTGGSILNNSYLFACESSCENGVDAIVAKELAKHLSSTVMLSRCEQLDDARCYDIRDDFKGIYVFVRELALNFDPIASEIINDTLMFLPRSMELTIEQGTFAPVGMLHYNNGTFYCETEVKIILGLASIASGGAGTPRIVLVENNVLGGLSCEVTEYFLNKIAKRGSTIITYGSDKELVGSYANCIKSKDVRCLLS